MKVRHLGDDVGQVALFLWGALSFQGGSPELLVLKLGDPATR